jgi:hypothetical protein
VEQHLRQRFRKGEHKHRFFCLNNKSDETNSDIFFIVYLFEGVPAKSKLHHKVVLARAY